VRIESERTMQEESVTGEGANLSRRIALLLTPFALGGCALFSSAPKQTPLSISIKADNVLNEGPPPLVAKASSPRKAKAATPEPAPKPGKSADSASAPPADAQELVSYPVAIRLFALKNAFAFQQADFEALTTNEAETLRPALLARWEFIVTPGASVAFKDNVPPEATVFGAIGLFRDITGGSWRSILALDPGKENNIIVSVAGKNVGLTPEKKGWSLF